MKKVIISLVFAAVAGISVVHFNGSSDSSKPLNVVDNTYEQNSKHLRHEACSCLKNHIIWK